MKMLALNSSPRGGGQSKTELMLGHLVKGMQKAGAEVDIINLRHKKINFCRGCLICWAKTPGVCAQKDDMTLELYPKWLGSDIAVYASPLYHHSVNAQMKAFVERTFPTLLPFFELDGDKTFHPLRNKVPASVLMSVAGFPEASVFDALSFWAKKTIIGRSGLLAEIYRPAAELLPYSGKKDVILAAVEQAGSEIIAQGSVSAETMKLIRQPIASPETFAAVANMSSHIMNDKGLTPREFGKTADGAPRPDSVENLLAMLEIAFNPQKASDKEGVIQFNFSDKKPVSCFLTIGKEACTTHMGHADKAGCTIEGSFEVFADIIQGKADGGKMLMEGKYKASGDISLMMLLARD
jgi:putative sterol carrier protein